MRLIYPIVILFLLTSAGFAQLAPDKERFDVVLHPGDVEEKTLKVTNNGDAPIFKISSTQVSGNARGFIFLSIPGHEPIAPQDKAEIKVFFAVPPETKPGFYTGFIYLLDSTPPSMPLRIEFNLRIVGAENYGLGLSINDALSAETYAKANDPAEFDLAVKNLGLFRDVASIDTSPLSQGWTVFLLDGEKELSLPCEIPLDPGITHTVKLQISTSEPGKKGRITIVATSLGNSSRNASVDAIADFGMAIRGYKVDFEVPEKMTTNKTYKGAFKIMLDVKEKIFVGIVTPPELMVIPMAQVVEVSPEKAGSANFTMLASQPGDYPLVFRLIDSNGVPMPEEVVAIKVVPPEGEAVLTGDDFLHSTVASLCSPVNRSVAIITVPPGKISDKDRDLLQRFASVVILGNQSIVSQDAEKVLDGIDHKRLEGVNLCEENWLFIAEMWQNGTSQVVLSGDRPADIFRAYQAAKEGGWPLVVCDGAVTQTIKSRIADLTKRPAPLTTALTVGEIGDDMAKALRDAGVLVQEVAK